MRILPGNPSSVQQLKQQCEPWARRKINPQSMEMYFERSPLMLLHAAGQFIVVAACAVQIILSRGHVVGSWDMFDAQEVRPPGTRQRSR